jgi:hypothetical protein
MVLRLLELLLGIATTPMLGLYILVAFQKVRSYFLGFNMR